MSTSRSEGVQYTTGEEQRAITNSSRKNEVTGPKRKWCSAVNMSGGERTVQCCKEQRCVETWNGRSMNQDKLDVVKWEMTKVSINILGISELKWMGKGEFNSYDHYIYYFGRESHRRNGVPLIVNKSPKYSTWVHSQKWQNDLCLFPRKTIQYHSNPSLCPKH